MLSKATIKYIHSLKINKFRNEHGIFIAEGTKVVLDILHSHLKITALYASSGWLETYGHYVSALPVTPITVTEKELHSISSLTTPQPVIALVEIPSPRLDLAEIQDQLVLMIDTIRDPGNMGTIIRTADWFGIRHIICSMTCVDTFNPKVVQASMGSVARIDVHYADLERVLEAVKGRLTVYGCLLEGDDIRYVALEKNGILLIGNESEGISPQLLRHVDQKLTIPSFSLQQGPFRSAESLNAAQACSIACYAFRR
jgi:TrmH family RNA methyltransferase